MREPSFEPPSDPLYRNTPEPFTLELPVLGLPVQFTSNSPAVIAVVESAFGRWAGLDASYVDARPPLRIRVLVHERAEPVIDGHASLVFRMPDAERTIMHAPGSVGIVDKKRGDAVVYVSPTLVADTAHFRYGVVEALTFALLTGFDRQPLHAAAIMRNGKALLLYGPSGAGKSTLTYAAARAGLQLLADDVVFVQSLDHLQVWGVPGFIHLPSDAGSVFPELAERPTMLHANGKPKIAVDIAMLGAVPKSPVARECIICVVGELRSQPERRRLPAQDALAAIDMTGDGGFDVFAETIRPAIQQLARGGGWLLHPGPDPTESVRLLIDILDEPAANE